MTIDEKTRLDLRQEFEKLFGTRLADATMEAMPPLDYEQLATKTDVANLGIQLRGEIADLRGDLKMEMANTLRVMVLAQISTVFATVGLVVGLT